MCFRLSVIKKINKKNRMVMDTCLVSNLVGKFLYFPKKIPVRQATSGPGERFDEFPSDRSEVIGHKG